MWTLFLSTIATSAVDSLNPIAISQQFVLQGMVKKARHIWYFILSIAVTNFASGILAYFGLIAPLGKVLRRAVEAYGNALYTAELVLGIGFLMAGCHALQGRRIARLKRQLAALRGEGTAADEEGKRARIQSKSVSPLSLTLLGIAATLSELTTALPYYAFLTILFQYELSLLAVCGVLVLYNAVYSLPLMILYFVYCRARDRFDRFYEWVRGWMERRGAELVPVGLFLIGAAMAAHAVS